jgi:hypothetical protein
MRRLSTLGVIALVAAAAGCDEGRTTVLEPFGGIGIGSAIGPSPSRVPTGTVSYRIVTTIDTTTSPDDTLSVDSVISLQVSNLRTFPGTYQVWITTVDTLTGLATVYAPTARLVERFRRDSVIGGVPQTDPVTGDIIRVLDSTVVGPAAQVYPGSDDPDVYEALFEFRPAGQPVNPFLAHSITLSTEAAQGSAPAGTQILWRRVGLGIGAAAATTVVFPNLPDSAIRIRTTSRTGGGIMNFGVYSGPDEAALISPADYPYAPGGTGTIVFRGPEVVADLRELPRPPTGYFYRGFLVDTLGNALLVDTLRSAYSALASGSRVSMFDADVNGLLPGISVTSITRSQIRNCGTGAGIAGCANTLGLSGLPTGTFGGYELFVLTLEPKGGSSAFDVSTVILSATIPERVWEN